VRPKTRGTRDRGFRSVCAGLGIPLLLLVACSAAGQMTSVNEEYRTKAAFLATFSSFIDWPDSRFPESAAPFLVCVVGDFQCGTSLAELT
jgi:hypothetical protein